MTDFIDLALKYGGFTSLDRVYLEQVLAGLTEEQKLSFIKRKVRKPQQPIF